MQNIKKQLETTHDFVVKFLENRGFSADSMSFLQNPTEDLIHNGEMLQDVTTFVNILHEKKATNIGIIPDYDTDGIMSGTVLAAGLDVLGFPSVTVYPPTTHTGYGLTEASVDGLLELNSDIQTIITTDNGITAFDGIVYAKRKGLSILVTDHHLGKEEEPVADVIVNPNRHTDTYPFKTISGTMVIWKSLQQYAKTYATSHQASLIDALLPFAGISTISDVMPILDENRYFVVETVRQLSDRNQLIERANGHKGAYSSAFLGLHSLLSVLESNRKMARGLNADTIGFYITPVLNSPRRISGESKIGFELFSQTTAEQALEKANELYKLNEFRKEEVRAISTNVKKYYDADVIPCGVVTVANTRGGFAGLIAGNITSQYDVPSIVFSLDATTDDTILFEDNEKSLVNIKALAPRLDYRGTVIHGSARSPEWFSLHEALSDIQDAHPEYFSSFGGHAQAAGLGVYVEHLTAFARAFEEKATHVFETLLASKEGAMRSNVDFNIGRVYFPSRQDVDYTLASPNTVSILTETIETFKQFEPFGQSFHAPSFKFTFSTNDVTTSFMGSDKQHVKFRLPEGIDIIQWNGADYLRETLGNLPAPFVFEATGKMDVNVFRDTKTPNLLVDNLTLLSYT